MKPHFYINHSIESLLYVLSVIFVHYETLRLHICAKHKKVDLKQVGVFIKNTTMQNHCFFNVCMIVNTMRDTMK